MALIVNINIASPAPLTVSPERDDGLISPLNGCNGVMVKVMVSGYAPAPGQQLVPGGGWVPGDLPSTLVITRSHSLLSARHTTCHHASVASTHNM